MSLLAIAIVLLVWIVVLPAAVLGCAWLASWLECREQERTWGQ